MKSLLLVLIKIVIQPLRAPMTHFTANYYYLIHFCFWGREEVNVPLFGTITSICLVTIISGYKIIRVIDSMTVLRSAAHS